MKKLIINISLSALTIGMFYLLFWVSDKWTDLNEWWEFPTLLLVFLSFVGLTAYTGARWVDYE